MFSRLQISQQVPSETYSFTHKLNLQKVLISLKLRFQCLSLVLGQNEG
jgi:hypothetical protein